jgi:hypothetical protein
VFQEVPYGPRGPALDRCERILVAMARLNIDERLVRISERQGKLVTEVTLGAFCDIGLRREIADYS